MDLVAGAKNIVVAMMHTSPKGESKLLPECSLPLTGVHCVHKIVTDLGVLTVDREQGCFRLLERAADVSVEEIKAKTAAPLLVAEDVAVLAV